MMSKLMIKQNFKQRGFTIIELMISFALGAFILGALTTLFFNSATASKSEAERHMMRDNARVALEQVAVTIRHAGYRGRSGGALGSGFWTSAASAGVCKDGGSNFASNFDSVYSQGNDITRNSISNNNSTVGVVYVADKRLNNDAVGATLRGECWFGSAVGLDASLIYNDFFVDLYSGESTGRLAVRTSLSLDGDVESGYTLADNVRSFRVLYGVDNDSDANVDQFMNAQAVQAGDLWTQVIAVELGILMRSGSVVLNTPQQRTYKVLDSEVSVNDRYAYDIYTKTVKIRNMTL